MSAAIKDERSFEERMSKALIPNREHLVYYAKSMKPGVDLCFICAAYNLATVQAHHIRKKYGRRYWFFFTMILLSGF
jgi:hypothetical protein